MKYLIAPAVLAVLALGAWALWPHAVQTITTMRIITAGGAQFKVEVADTESSRELGLGARASLPPGQGMWFVFDHPGNWGFWMKDTLIPLDMLWVREDGTVTTIARDVLPASYPAVYYPKTPDAAFVLEVNAGAAAGIAEGDRVVVQ